MLPRYLTNFQISTTRDGRRYFQSGITNIIPPDIFQYTIIAQDGDRFDTLASRYYKDASKWWIIAKANNLLNGTMFVKGGTQLIIPSAGL
jgi:nucleoid-associated protein YgaU